MLRWFSNCAAYDVLTLLLRRSPCRQKSRNMSKRITKNMFSKRDKLSEILTMREKRYDGDSGQHAI